jgi:hypothetical protein
MLDPNIPTTKATKKIQEQLEPTNFKVQVYLDDGRVFEYEVSSAEKVREHAAAIIKGGYRHNDGKVFEHYPPHRLLKVKSENIDTLHQDITRGT